MDSEKKIEGKDVMIKFRIEKRKKEKWKNICNNKNISLSSLIIDSVENKILDDERRKILMFIEKQDNIFAKIENNINQIARHVNVQKFISTADIKVFNDKLDLITELKNQQNKIFEKIYKLIGNDS
ncbi:MULTISPECIES: hypothetical protein [Elizabethkingia]|uniref:Bacterial mobilisation domain-containing protein n=3 Tax=Elizabethkingia anophelis TaxID=1117645 RepID=A0A455ZG91_9FLAO|nr:MULTISPECIES: hypothetical protein [Elizabethkingia]AIL44388.1 hypothetical protein BD94_0613 [Elizabethkingia anophelis NUHP1]ATC35609.1 hypothetical protein BAZ09_004995 [Elizabethkingia anophelis R26]ATC39247.1 hypothetical protein EAAG1_004995 [Elizabethkingia anophelis Ag1]ATC42928.1 hypothetical protein CMV41_04995 [Elizabethkingia anophelis]ATC46604.1 hypothetical protein CMV40_04995 [Elizabethkingia anophelis]